MIVAAAEKREPLIRDECEPVADDPEGARGTIKACFAQIAEIDPLMMNRCCQFFLMLVRSVKVEKYDLIVQHDHPVHLLPGSVPQVSVMGNEFVYTEYFNAFQNKEKADSAISPAGALHRQARERIHGKKIDHFISIDYDENVNKKRRGKMYPYGKQFPKIAPDVFIAPGAQVIGQVELAAGSSVWFNAVLRGDVAGIFIGEGSNIQDGTIVHTDTHHPVKVGRNVTIGHNVTLHGCTVEDGALIGMGSTILNGAVIKKGALVAAGSLVLQNQVVEAGVLVTGVPAQKRRKLTDANVAYLKYDAAHYIEQAKRYMDLGINQNRTGE